MNLRNFEKHINKNIVERGYDYYIDGNVVEIFEEDKNRFKIMVKGTEEYEVEVDINGNGDILNSYCDCPYDFGPICKHEVAAYFKLFEVLNNNNNNTNKTIKKKINIHKELKELTGEKFNKYYKKIKSSIKSSTYGIDSAIFQKLIEEERDEDEIIKLVRESPYLVERYKDILDKSYKEEVVSIYKKNSFSAF